MRTSLRNRLALLLAIFVFLLIVLPFVANTFFLEKYYLRYKMNTLENTYTSLENAYQGNISSVKRLLEQWELNEGLRFTIANSNFQIVYSTRSEESRTYNNMVPFMSALPMMEGIIKNYFSAYNGQPVITIKQNPSDNSGNLTIYGKENIQGQELYIIIETPLSAIKESITLSNKFLLMSSFIAIILAAFTIFFVANRFTKPILQINKITTAMSGLDFSQKIRINSADELGQLGESINELSSHLERSINDLKAANQQLQEDIRQKEKIADMRKEFISNVSHELKTPLALIIGYTEGLQLNINSEDKNAYCDIILDEAEKMNHLVKQLLAVSQLESGAAELEIEEFNLAALLSWILEKNTLRIAEKHCTLELDIPDEAFVTADYRRIDQVITNYLTNALNHVGEPGMIRVTLKQVDDRFRLGIYNSGENIPEDVLPRLWESFYKTDKARTREYGGQGLGLYIVKTIMTAHNNAFGVENQEGGVEFWFELTAAAPPDDWDKDAEKSADTPRNSNPLDDTDLTVI